MKKLNFKRLHTDNCIFVHEKNLWQIIIIYVDDFIIMAKIEKETTEIANKLKKIGSYTDQGKLK